MNLQTSWKLSGVFGAWLGLIVFTPHGLTVTSILFIVLDLCLGLPVLIELIGSVLLLTFVGTLATYLAASRQ